MVFSRLFTVILGMVALFVTALAYAKDVNLYDQPQANAKVVGTVDLTVGVVPIFTPKAGDWMKVGDPRNGNTGWIKTSDFSGNGGPQAVTFTQHVVKDAKGEPRVTQLLQFGTPNQMSDKEAQDMLQKVRMQQQAAQQSLQKAVQDMMNTMQQLYKNNPMFQAVPIVAPAPTKPVTNPGEPATIAPKGTVTPPLTTTQPVTKQ